MPPIRFNMKLQVGVKIILKNSKNEILLLKRNSEKYYTNGQWDIPGGRIDPGTSLEDNLRREIKEETQYDFTGQAKIISAQDIFVSDDHHVVRLTYICNVQDFTPILDEEHTDFVWSSKEEIPKIDLDCYLSKILHQIYTT